MTSKPALRILSAVVEPTICAVSCNLSAAGNASRIWRAASPGEAHCKMEIPGGLRVGLSGFQPEILHSASPNAMHVIGIGSRHLFPFIFSLSLHGVRLYTLSAGCSSGFFLHASGT